MSDLIVVGSSSVSSGSGRVVVMSDLVVAG